MDRLLELTKQHKTLMDTENIIISVYRNASSFLWQVQKLDSGTDLGWSDTRSDAKWRRGFSTYEDALEDALNLVSKANLTKFQTECSKSKFHWGNYVEWLRTIK